MSFTTIDLFAGVGGLSIGLMKARNDGKALFDVRLLVDSDKMAAHSFRMNEPRLPKSPSGHRNYLVGDIMTISPATLLKEAGLKAGQLDVLVGGPPCQGFSAAGKSLIDHPKNALLKRFIELAVQLKPKMILMENVPQVINWNNGQLYKEVDQLLSANYSSRWDSLQANQFGVPQLRRRAFLAAIRVDLVTQEFDFPEHEQPKIRHSSQTRPQEEGVDMAVAASRYITVEDAIGDLPSLKAGQSAKQYLKEPYTDYQQARRAASPFLFNHEARGHREDFLERKVKVIDPGRANKDLPKAMRFERENEKADYYSQAYGRLHPKMVAQTITTMFMNPGSGRFTHYKDDRAITVREAARIQSFDDSFVFHGDLTDQSRHVGNAVPPIMARKLGEHFGSLLLAKPPKTPGSATPVEPGMKTRSKPRGPRTVAAKKPPKKRVIAAR